VPELLIILVAIGIPILLIVAFVRWTKRRGGAP
jgi:hypothetical protein